MNEKQKCLLSQLNHTIILLSRECEQDDNFNIAMGNLSIFQSSLDNCSNKLFEAIETYNI